MMPIIPFVGDDTLHLEELVQATKDHGGSCVLAGGMTMDGVQAKRTLGAAIALDPALEQKWRRMYRWNDDGQPKYGPPPAYNARIGKLVRTLCSRYGLLDRMPRYIPSGPLAINKQVAEKLFLRTYDLELEQASGYQIWAYRKAAWTVDECETSIKAIYQEQGEVGLRALPAIGKGIAQQIAVWLDEEVVEPRNE
jgi:hypothetical protein